MKEVMLFLMAVGCGALAFYFHKQLDALRRYEFENTTAGGVVQFQSYEASKRHERLKQVLPFRRKLCVIFAVMFLIGSAA